MRDGIQLLRYSMLIFAGCACSLTADALTITSSISPTGTTSLRLSGLAPDSCFTVGQTSYVIAQNSITLTTQNNPPNCFSVMPPSNVDVVVDVGQLLPGHYDVSWTFPIPLLAPTTHAMLDVITLGGTLCPFAGNPGSDGTGGFLDISPTAPNSSQTVIVTAGRIRYPPLQTTTNVQGNHVVLNLLAPFVGFGVPPPATCTSTAVGPLPPGNYTVDVYITSVDSTQPPPFLSASASLQVLAAAPSGPESVPTLSAGLLATLALLLGLIGAFAYRRRST